MSKILYHEEISGDMAADLIGLDNIKKGAQYFLVTEQYSTTVLRREASGDEVEFPLEEAKHGYNDSIDFAKIEPVIDRERKPVMGLFVIILMVMAFCGGIAAMAFLLTHS